jgi:hypothetical protein
VACPDDLRCGQNERGSVLGLSWPACRASSSRPRPLDSAPAGQQPPLVLEPPHLKARPSPQNGRRGRLISSSTRSRRKPHRLLRALDRLARSSPRCRAFPGVGSWPNLVNVTFASRVSLYRTRAGRSAFALGTGLRRKHPMVPGKGRRRTAGGQPGILISERVLSCFRGMLSPKEDGWKPCFGWVRASRS